MAHSGETTPVGFGVLVLATSDPAIAFLWWATVALVATIVLVMMAWALASRATGGLGLALAATLLCGAVLIFEIALARQASEILRLPLR